MSQIGWIKLYRSIKAQPWYNDSEAVHLFIHLLLSANHDGREAFWQNKLVTVKPGQFITGRKQLSAETGIHESKVQRLLKKFESCRQIEQQTNNTNRLISVVCWQKFQQGEQQMNNERTTIEQRSNNERTLYKELKNNKEIEEVEEAATDIFQIWKIQILDDQIFTDEVGMKYKLIGTALEAALEEFISYKLALGETSHRDYSDFRKNFRLWIPKNLNGQNNGNGKSRNNTNLISDQQARNVFAKLSEAGY